MVKYNYETLTFVLIGLGLSRYSINSLFAQDDKHPGTIDLFFKCFLGENYYLEVGSALCDFMPSHNTASERKKLKELWGAFGYKVTFKKDNKGEYYTSSIDYVGRPGKY